jgi:subtilisin family serine protease
MRTLTKRLLGTGVVAAVAALAVLSSTATGQSPTPNTRVIVVLRNQERSLPPTRALEPARDRAVRSDQARVISQLSSDGAANVQPYTVLNAVAATVSPEQETQLASNPAVSAVVPDAIIHLTPPQSASPDTGAAGVDPLPGACSDPGQVQLNPQALATMQADSDNPSTPTARSLGITGAGVTVGFIADGLDINNADFIRANGTHVFVDYKDFSGEGTAVPTGGEEAFLDAGSIAAQGRQVYNVSNYSALELRRPCLVRIEGVAPGASLVGLDVFGSEDAGFSSSILQAINYAVTVDHVNVLNESFGSNFYPDDAAALDLIKQANDLAQAAGTTVTVSSGDAGVTSTIGSPATDPNVIAVGASTTYRLDAQDGYGGARFPGVTGWLDDNISSLSSGGFTQDGHTIDVVAPGELNWGLCSTDTAMYSDCVNLAGQPTAVAAIGGTSESAPLTAGVAALVIQAYAQTHGGALPSPAVVKQIIVSTADDIGAPAEQQGAGRVNAYRAVLAAESYPGAGSPTPVGETLLTATGQLGAVGAPGSARTLTDTITNNGAATQTIDLSTRAIGNYQPLTSAAVQLSDTASPHMTDWQGITDNYEPVTFVVPPGQNRLNAAIAFQNASVSLEARVRLTLVDPAGNLAAYSVPQGDGNYGDVQVTDPAAGQWTAYIYSRDSAHGGTTGPVVFGARSAQYVPFGQVSPSVLQLAPGQSAPITLSVTTPATPGDAAGAIVLHPAGGSDTTIPVTLRSLIPAGPASFSATLTGGNGRELETGETFYYQLALPAGRPELNASITLGADNANNPFDAWLVSPSGEAVAFAANAFPSDSPTGSNNEIGAQLHALAPAAGTWTLIVAFAPTVSGAALSEPFTVATNQFAVTAFAPSLPDSNSTRLRAGHSYTYDVAIRNSGPAPEAYFPDARLPGSVALPLASLGDRTTTVPLNINQNIPVYLVPTHTTSFVEQASTTGPLPILFDSSSAAGDPDLGSTAGATATASLSASPVSQGVWAIVPDVVGTFGASGAAGEPVTTSMTATTSPFDPAVTSPAGDLWLAAADPTTLAGFNPVLANPGQAVTVPVTITPSGPPGSIVSGTLYIDDANTVLFQVFNPEPNGNDVVAIPYTYRIG